MKYRKKPVTIDAFKFDGTVDCLRKNVDKKDWFRFEFEYADPTTSIDSLSLEDRYSFEVQDYAYSFEIATLEGLHRLLKGDYVIKGVHGEYYPCKPDIFEETYEKVDEK